MPRQPSATFIVHAHFLARAAARNAGYPYTTVKWDAFSQVWEAGAEVRGYSTEAAT